MEFVMNKYRIFLSTEEDLLQTPLLTRRADGVSERDGAPADVDLGFVELQLLQDRQGLRRERLVQLPQVHRLLRPPGL